LRAQLAALEGRLEGLAGNVSNKSQETIARWQQLQEAGKDAAEQARTEQGTLRAQLRALEGRLEGLAGNMSDNSEAAIDRLQRLEKSGNEAAEKARAEGGTLRAQLVQLEARVQGLASSIGIDINPRLEQLDDAGKDATARTRRDQGTLRTQLHDLGDRLEALAGTACDKSEADARWKQLQSQLGALGHSLEGLTASACKREEVMTMCKKLEEASKTAADETKTDRGHLQEQVRQLEGQLQCLVGSVDDRWRKLEEQGNSATQSARSQHASLRSEVEQLSSHLSCLVQHVEAAFLSERTRLEAAGPTSPAAFLRRIDSAFSAAGHRLDQLDRMLEQVKEEAGAVKAEASKATRDLAEQTGRELDLAKSQWKQIEGHVRAGRDTTGRLLQDLPELARRLEARVDRLEKQGQHDTSLTTQRLETRIETLAAQMQREFTATGHMCEQRLETLAIQRSRDMHAGVQQLSLRLDKLETQRQRDISDISQRMDGRLSTLNLDREFEMRERRLNERVDVLASHMGASVKQLEQRIRDLKHNTCTKREAAALMIPKRPHSPPNASGLRSLPASEWNYRVEWDVSEKDFAGYSGPRSVDSPEFSLGSTSGLVLRFHPSWDVAAKSCLLAVVAPYELGLACHLSLDGHIKEGKRLPLSGNSDGTVFYAADFPMSPGGQYENIAVEFSGQAVTHPGQLRLT